MLKEIMVNLLSLDNLKSITNVIVLMLNTKT